MMHSGSVSGNAALERFHAISISGFSCLTVFFCSPDVALLNVASGFHLAYCHRNSDVCIGSFGRGKMAMMAVMMEAEGPDLQRWLE